MTGSRKPIVVLQERDQRLLEELGTMRVINREQAKIVAGFGSTTRANTRLLALTRAGLLKRASIGGNESVYMLPSGNSKSAGPSQSSKSEPVSIFFVQHQLKINDLYLRLRYRPLPSGIVLRRWLAFTEPLSRSVPLIPDGYFELESSAGNRPSFLEVDLGTEALPIWQRKTQLYLQLAVSGEFSRIFQKPQFRVLVIAPTERRLSNIRSTVSKITDKIFWFATFDSINGANFWSPVWLRAKGDQLQSLL